MLKKEKKLCADKLVSMISEDLRDAGYEDLINTFKQSKTYSLLYDFRTGLWEKGPDYIVGEFAKEKVLKLTYLEMV